MTERTSFDVDKRNRLRRRHDRGRYDKASIYPILDAALLCHIAYAIDGQPYCTPTAFWREGDALYWHGSAASRMLRAQAKGIDVCLTVTHLDGLVLARSGFNHSINYRSVMAFGRAALIEEPGEKRRAMDAFVDRFYPGRNRLLRAPTAPEIKATSIVGMEIEQASAKIRSGPPHDDEEDHALPVWAGVVPVATVIGPAVDCPRLSAGLARQADLAELQPGRRLDEAFAAAYRRSYGSGRDAPAGADRLEG